MASRSIDEIVAKVQQHLPSTYTLSNTRHGEDYAVFTLSSSNGRRDQEGWKKLIRPLVEAYGSVSININECDWLGDSAGWPTSLAISIPLKENPLVDVATPCSNAYRRGPHRGYHFFSQAALAEPLTISLVEYGVADVTISSNLTGDALKKAILEALYAGILNCNSTLMLDTFVTRFTGITPQGYTNWEPSIAFQLLNKPQGFLTCILMCFLSGLGFKTDAAEAFETLVSQRRATLGGR